MAPASVRAVVPLTAGVRHRASRIARVRRCGATGPLSLWADSGFYSGEMVGTCERLGVAYSITVNLNASIQAAIDKLAEDAWQRINYTDGGEAEVAETAYVTGGGKTKRSERRLRLVVRRTRICDPAVQQVFPTWRHHALVTNVGLDAVAADAFHGNHATVELAIRDLKEGARLENCPSGRFFANATWLCCAVLAHDLRRSASLIGGITAKGVLAVARTARRQLFALPGRLVNRSGLLTVRLHEHRPWAAQFLGALERLRSLRLVT